MPWRVREGWGGGPLDFMIVQEKIALSLKTFSRCVRWRRGTEKKDFFSRTTQIKHVYLERDNGYVCHDLLKSYFFGWIYFSGEKKKPNKTKWIKESAF